MLKKYSNDRLYHNTITTVPFHDFNFIIYYAELMDTSIPVFEHRHELYEIFYGLEGSVTFHCSRQKIELFPDSAIFLGKNQLHRSSFYSDDHALYFTLLFDIEPKNISDEEKLEYKEIEAALDYINSQKYVYLPKSTSQSAFLQSIREETHQCQIGWSSRIGFQYYSFFLNILRQICPQKSNINCPPGYTNIALEATKYIHSNYANELTLDMVSEQLNVSPRHMNRLFKELFNCSFSRTVNIIRMKYAQKYLRTTNDTIESIVGRVGLPSGKALTKLFYEEEGISPSEYRASCRKKQNSK